MNRRDFVTQSLGMGAGAAVATAAPATAAGREPPGRRRQALANDYTVLWRASDPMHEIGYCPALARLPGGRLIGCMLHAGTDLAKQREWTVKVHTSDDRGRTCASRTTGATWSSTATTSTC